MYVCVYIYIYTHTHIVLGDKVTVLISSLFKLFSIKLVEELLGKIHLWGSFILLEGVLMIVYAHSYIYIYIYIYSQIHTHIWIYIYIYIYTHTHTLNHFSLLPQILIKFQWLGCA